MKNNPIPQPPRYLTKSLFKLAAECPAKLYYTKKAAIYPNQKADDPFLAALAEGGFQVGELARQYYPGGILIEAVSHEEALRQTAEAMQKEEVIIFEAAIRYGNFFIRVDILEKKRNQIKIIEVKAKSYDPQSGLENFGIEGSLPKKWFPYIADVAFQKAVASLAFPQYSIKCYLMLANKKTTATVDGLNQKFFIRRLSGGQIKISVPANLGPEELGNKILVKVNVDESCNRLYEGSYVPNQDRPFHEWLEFLAENYQQDKKIITPVSATCKKCEFTCSPEQENAGLRSGYKECWTQQLNWSESDFAKPRMLDIWDFRRTSRMIGQQRYFMEEISDDDLGLHPDVEDEMSRTERQRIQIDKAVSGDNTPCILIEGLKKEMATWKFPLHFIDFETTALAIPFTKGRHPYEGIAFQYSHHMVHADGTVVHKGQYIQREQGVFPNFDFLRALKKELEQDEGTIFRFAAHENTYLNIIYSQLKSGEEPDRDVLCDWIKTITHSTERQEESWEGARDMVDMCEIVKRFHYDPMTGGSNSIKKVLPAILNRSRFLQEKYAKPIYGTPTYPSHNFNDFAWIRNTDQGVENPYHLLPPLFEGVADEQLDDFITDEHLSDGGAAMMAYARMQFSEMTAKERKQVIEGLLRYCELDTLAMVMIWEYWKFEIFKVISP